MNKKLKINYLGENDVMPIGGWWGPYKSQNKELPNYLKENYFKLIKDSGINFISVTPNTFNQNEQEVREAIKLSHKYQLGYFVNDEFLFDENNIPLFKKRLNLYSKKNVIGSHFPDEPMAKNFKKYKNLISAYNLCEKNRLAYVNLLPNYGGGNNHDEFFSEGVKMSYEEYLENFFENVPVKMISYDFYPFYKDDRAVNCRKKYFDNLSLIKNYSDKKQIPFWPFIQIGGDWNDNKKEIPISFTYPNENELMWNVNTNLAYGAKGIQYFTIIQPEHFAWSENNTRHFARNGMIGADGSINRWYYYVMRINNQIKVCQKFLMNCECKGIIAIGESLKRDLIGSENIDKGKFQELIKIDGDDILIGCMKYYNETIFYVVNNNFNDFNKVKLIFDNFYKINIIQNAVNNTTNANYINLQLKGGEGVLVHIEKITILA